MIIFCLLSFTAMIVISQVKRAKDMKIKRQYLQECKRLNAGTFIPDELEPEIKEEITNIITYS